MQDLRMESCQQTDKPRFRNSAWQSSMTLDLSDTENVTRPRKRVRQQQRQRVSQACCQCRSGKLKCDGAQPLCCTCADTGKSCSYDRPVRRRGLKTGYVRALECLWGLVFQNVAESEVVVQKLLDAKLGQDLSGDGSSLEYWRSSQIPQKIQKLLSGTEASEDDIEETVKATELTQKSSSTLRWTTQAQTIQTQLEEPDSSSASWSSKQNQLGPRPMIDSLAFSIPAASPFPPILQLPLGWRKSLADFFSYTQCWLPIVERDAIYRTSYAYRRPQDSLSLHSLESGEHALLWAILAYTAVQDSANRSGDGRFGQSAKEGLTSGFLYTNARNLIPSDNEASYTIGHVQALLLIGLCHCTTGDWNTSWFLIGQAILVATELGLNQPAIQERWEKQLARRVWLGCFVLHTLLAARLRRVPHLRKDDAENCLPIEGSGIEEWGPWQAPDSGNQFLDQEFPTHAFSTFNHLLRLVIILNGSLRDLSSEKLQDKILELRKWSTELPMHCQQESDGSMSNLSSSSTTPNVFNLYVVHATILLVLSRACEDEIESLTCIQQEAQQHTNILTILNQSCNAAEIAAMLPVYDFLVFLVSTPNQPHLSPKQDSTVQVSRALASFGFTFIRRGSIQPNNLRDSILNDNHTIRGPTPPVSSLNPTSVQVIEKVDKPYKSSDDHIISDLFNVKSKSFPLGQHSGPSINSMFGINPQDLITPFSDHVHHSRTIHAAAHQTPSTEMTNHENFPTPEMNVDAPSGTRLDANDDFLASWAPVPPPLPEDNSLMGYFQLLDDYEIDQTPFKRNLGYTS